LRLAEFVSKDDLAPASSVTKKVGAPGMDVMDEDDQ
jgi:hypothetical protein